MVQESDLLGPLHKLLDLQWLRLRRRDLFRLTGGAMVAGGTPARAADQEACAASSPVWVSYFREKNVWGYVDRHSVFPGETFELMLSTGPARKEAKGHVEVFRIAPLSVAGGQRLMWRSPTLQVAHESVLRTAAAIGTHWPPALH